MNKTINKLKKSPPWYFSALAGFLAGGMALVVGEIAAGFNPNSPTIIQAYGESIIRSNLVPNSFRDFSIDNLGQTQKPILTISVIVVILLVSIGLGIFVGWLGNPKRKNFFKKISRFRFLIGAGAIAIFAILTGLALGSHSGSSAVHATLTSLLASGVAFILFFLMIGVSESRFKIFHSQLAINHHDETRRNFLLGAGAVTLTGLVGGFVGRRLINFQRSVQAIAEAVTLLNATPSVKTFSVSDSETLNNVAGISQFITPNDNFYLIDTALVKPTLDHKTWSLKVTGMVENELELSFQDILNMGLVEEMVTLSCVSNVVGGTLVGNAIWRGVPLTQILDLAGAEKTDTQVVGRSHDRWTGGFPTQLVYEPDRTSLVAVEMNGEPLPRIHGFPARLVVSGLYGYVSATKWLTEIEITDLNFDPYWIPRGWSKEGPVKTQSRIDIPYPAREIPAGTTAIAGVAWAPHRGISKVEVKVEQNGGSNNQWREAELSNDLTDNSWRQWHIGWDLPPANYEAFVRATDGEGNTQTSISAPPRPNGSSGWDSVRFRVI